MCFWCVGVVDVCVCVMKRVDELSWCFFHVFSLIPYSSLCCCVCADFFPWFSSRFFMFEDFLRRAYLFLHVWFILLVWSLMIWILRLFNAFSDFSLIFFNVVRFSCADIGLELKKKKRRSKNLVEWAIWGLWRSWFSDVLMMMRCILCDDVCLLSCVYFLLIVACLFRDVSVNTPSFCVRFCVSLRVDVSYYRRFALYHDESWFEVKIIFLKKKSRFHWYWSFSFFRDHSRICSKWFVTRRRSNHSFYT